jgi:hypothetical protein
LDLDVAVELVSGVILDIADIACDTSGGESIVSADLVVVELEFFL